MIAQNPESLSPFYAKARIAVTGGAGTVGSRLVQQLLSLPVAEVRVLDNNESELFFLSERYAADERLQCFLADIRDERKIHRMLRGMDMVFHTAALKHVVISERSPTSTLQTNILGLQNVIAAAQAHGVRRLLFTSSDKAVNPTNVMGASKLMGERLITAANATLIEPEVGIFTSTRFGNVAGSRGSVIPLFCRQIAAGDPVTLTDPAMTRFVMTLGRSVDMLLETMAMAIGGEVFVTKMPVVRIIDIAKVMVRLIAPLYGRPPDARGVVTTGMRPGEKLWEELTTDEEIRRTVELEDYFVVLPAFRNIYREHRYEYPDTAAAPATRRYVSSSEPVLSEAEVEHFLLQPDVLPDEIRSRLVGQEKHKCVS
jgi:FlaA1/EpsC-like NDP-sugar epimerase